MFMNNLVDMGTNFKTLSNDEKIYSTFLNFHNLDQKKVKFDIP
jgi:hypothetical protein